MGSIIIYHGLGVETKYGNLKEMPEVGKSVKSGEIIATSGDDDHSKFHTCILS